MDVADEHPVRLRGKLPCAQEGGGPATLPPTEPTGKGSAGPGAGLPRVCWRFSSQNPALSQQDGEGVRLQVWAVQSVDLGLKSSSGPTC